MVIDYNALRKICGDIVKNPKDYTAKTLERLFMEYGDAFHKEQMNRMDVKIVENKKDGKKLRRAKKAVH